MGRGGSGSGTGGPGVGGPPGSGGRGTGGVGWPRTSPGVIDRPPAEARGPARRRAGILPVPRGGAADGAPAETGGTGRHADRRVAAGLPEVDRTRRP